MDPATIIGVAAAAIQFIDFSTKLLSKSYEIWTSSTGELLEESHGRMITTKILQLNGDIRKSYSISSCSQTDEGILELCDSCDELAQKLVAALNDVKSGGSGKSSKKKVFKYALKSLWSKSEIERLDRLLEKCRQQLAMHILFSVREQQAQFGSEIQYMRAESKPLLEELVKHLKWSEEWRQEFLEAARKDPRLTLSPHATTEPSNLDDFADSILRMLPFESMRRREEQVPEAHNKTFGWVFQPPEARQIGQDEIHLWNSFVDWLGNDSSLYWITGKAGAGKSTLMKLICMDERTTALLRNWTKDCPVVISHCYLWNSGAEIQMSQDGLLRTLLYQALCRLKRVQTEGYLDLIGKCFSERWEIHELLEPEDLWPISEAELQLALERLVRFDPTTRFVFLIDGLDEYSGECAHLVGFIRRMANNQNIKLCVASRPWPIFQDAFERGPSLQLEDLTYPDFVEFVESNFASSPGFAQLRAENARKADELVQGITEKASGVFLWVSLVVRMLLKELEYGERLSDLQALVEALPADLENLFQKMLDSIDPEKMEHASQIFQIFRTAQTEQQSVSVACLAFADEDDPDFPFELPIRPLTSKEENARAERMCRRLQSLCKGLLEARKGPGAKVEYLHRTVKDFLDQPETWKKVTHMTQASFDPNMPLCRSSLLQLKCVEVDNHRQDHSLNEWPWVLVSRFIKYSGTGRSDASLEGLLSTLYDELATTTQTLISREGTCKEPTCWCHGPSDHIDGPFLSLAVSQNLIAYVCPRLSQIAPERRILRQDGNSLLKTALVYTFYGTPKYNNVSSIPPMVKLLFESGADPNLGALDQKKTAWEFLVKVVCDHTRTTYPIEILRLFLENGADPFVSLASLTTSRSGFADVLRLQKQLQHKARSRRAHKVLTWFKRTFNSRHKVNNGALSPSPATSSAHLVDATSTPP